MTADLDLTATLPGHALRDRLLALDCRIFEAVAARHWPGADPLLPKLSRSANHGVLWFGTAAALAVDTLTSGPPRGRPRHRLARPGLGHHQHPRQALGAPLTPLAGRGTEWSGS